MHINVDNFKPNHAYPHPVDNSGVLNKFCTSNQHVVHNFKVEKYGVDRDGRSIIKVD